jgi:hypothetical protein
MRKVAFDFDSTLDRESVQKYATELINSGDYEVWIVTSRPEVYTAKGWKNFSPDNDDLFKVADELGISRDHIHFTGYGLKSDFLITKGFVFLLDDDHVELKAVMSETACVAISALGSAWKHKCERVLNKKDDLDKPFLSLRNIEKVTKDSIKTKRQWMEIVNTSSVKFDRLVEARTYFK